MPCTKTQGVNSKARLISLLVGAGSRRHHPHLPKHPRVLGLIFHRTHFLFNSLNQPLWATSTREELLTAESLQQGGRCPCLCRVPTASSSL